MMVGHILAFDHCMERALMFDSLNEKIKADESKEGSRDRMIRWTIIIVGVAVLLLGGLYIGLRYFQTS
jgi:hypothetical protein